MSVKYPETDEQSETVNVKFKVASGKLMRVVDGKMVSQWCPYNANYARCGLQCPMFETNTVGYVFLKCNSVLCDIRDEEEE